MTRHLLSLAALLLTLAACSGSSTGSATPDPAIAFCAALGPYERTVVVLDQLTPSATVDQYTSAVADAKTALAAVVKVAGPFAGVQLNAAQTAQNNLGAAADELPADVTPAQAEVALDPYLQALIQELTGLRAALCNTTPTPSAAG